MLQYSSKLQTVQTLTCSIDDDRVFYKEMFTGYLNMCPELIEDIKVAVRSGDFEKTKCLSRSLEASSASVGAILMEFVGRKLQEIGPVSDPDRVDIVLFQMETQFTETKKAFFCFFDYLSANEEDSMSRMLDLAG